MHLRSIRSSTVCRINNDIIITPSFPSCRAGLDVEKLQREFSHVIRRQFSFPRNENPQNDAGNLIPVQPEHRAGNGKHLLALSCNLYLWVRRDLIGFHV